MTAKYYTPSIEEYFIGFECEIRVNPYKVLIVKNDTWYKNYGTPEQRELTEEEMKKDRAGYGNSKCVEWNKKTIDFDTFSSGDECSILLDYETEVRVKYLDEEDILSLGFEWVQTSGEMMQYILNIKGKVPIRLYYIKGRVVLSNHLANDMVLFDGKPKNKSELKKIMQILNIV